MTLYYGNRKTFLEAQNQYLDKVYVISSGLQLQPQDQICLTLQDLNDQWMKSLVLITAIKPI